MKIGIFTFHCAINYGAVLQAFGLQEYLKSIGHDVYIIDYRPNYLLYPYRVFRWKDSPKNFKDSLKWFIREVIVIPIRWKRKFVFSRFIKQYLNLCKLDLTNPDNDFDAFVFGSDQIWNKKITNGFDKFFWGAFPAAKGKRLVAYAASMGDANPTKTDFQYIKQKLGLFDMVGVRETSLCNILQSNNIPCSLVADPVLLAGKSIFDNLIVGLKPKDPYLLMFTLGRDEYVLPYVNLISAALGLQVKEIVSSRESLYKRNYKQALSPSSFLSYLVNASYVITSSFHGTVFSILYSKNFNVVGNGTHGDDRVLSLLEKLNLKSRFILVDDTRYDISNIDYDLIEAQKKELKDLSESFWTSFMSYE